MKTLLFFFIMLIMSGPWLLSQVEDVTIHADMVYGHKYGLALTFDVISPSQSNGAAVIFISSGGFVSGKTRFIKMNDDQSYSYVKKGELMILPEGFNYPPLDQFSPDELLENGFTIFDVRHGSSPKFTLDEIVDDCRKAVDYIQDNAASYRIDPGRIGLFSASAGGYIAAYLATTGMGVKTVVIYYPAGYDYIRLKKNSLEVYEELPAIHLDEEILAQLSLKEHISADDPPFLIIYGEEDFVFIKQASEDIASDLKKLNVECELVSIPGTGHEFRDEEGYQVEHGEFARLKMVEWFVRHLL